MKRPNRGGSPTPTSPAPAPKPGAASSPFGDFFKEQLGYEPPAAPEPTAAPPSALQTNAPQSAAAPARGGLASKALLDRFGHKMTVVVRLERKGRRGKTVTIVQGLELPAAEQEELARELRRHCGCGGTVEGSTIEVQGDQRDPVAAYLEGRGVRVRKSG